jgi:7-carboxy-7-deazaguanine synthase
MTTYAVKEIFRSLQGEGFHSGRPAVFCRFAGCNLWSGREEDRPAGPGSCAAWCDTDFAGTDGTHGGRYHAAALAAKVAEVWGPSRPHRFAVLTGGEPMLQVDERLVDTLHRSGFEVALETNGTRPIPFHTLDWITLSPKAGSAVVLDRASELKLVYPQDGLGPRDFADFPAAHFYLQPRDGPDREGNTAAAVACCLENPRWRLSLQAHKMLGIR